MISFWTSIMKINFEFLDLGPYNCINFKIKYTSLFAMSFAINNEKCSLIIYDKHVVVFGCNVFVSRSVNMFAIHFFNLPIKASGMASHETRFNPRIS